MASGRGFLGGKGSQSLGHLLAFDAAGLAVGGAHLEQMKRLVEMGKNPQVVLAGAFLLQVVDPVDEDGEDLLIRGPVTDGEEDVGAGGLLDELQGLGRAAFEGGELVAVAWCEDFHGVGWCPWRSAAGEEWPGQNPMRSSVPSLA